MQTKLVKFGFFASLTALSAVASAGSTAAQDAQKGIQNDIVIGKDIRDIKFPEGNKPLECRNFRVRILDVKAGKEVGIHSHENRPGLLSIVGGKGMVVYAYNYEPETILFGSSYKSHNDTVHYATNMSDTEKLGIMTTDFLDDGSECDGKKYPQYTPILDGLVKENHPFYADAPQSSEDNEVNHEFYRTLIKDIKIPAGKTPVNERILRVRKVTLDASASTGVQDYANRPSYIMDLEGTVEVIKQDTNETSKLNPEEAANLINTGKVEIRNTGDDEASYFVIELWDPNDKDIL